MIKEESVYKIGKLGKPHGIKGEISMQVDDDVFDRVDSFSLPESLQPINNVNSHSEGRGGAYLILKLDGIMVPFFIEEYRFKSNEVALIKFEGIDSLERAKDFVGTEVFFPRELADTASDDELSYAQLVGYTLVNAKDNKPVGIIDFIDEQTINIMFELKDGTLIPASEELIVDVDTTTKTITMNIPEGILSL